MENVEGRIVLPKPLGYRCFGCGSANPVGLNMNFYARGQRVCSDVVLGPNFMGWENVAHGGIISTILDETMAWAVVAFKRVFFVTKKIEVQYLMPAPLNESLTAMAEISPKPHSKGCYVDSELIGPDGVRLAKGHADMIFLPRERFPAIPEAYRRDMEQTFQEMRRLLSRDGR